MGDQKRADLRQVRGQMGWGAAGLAIWLFACGDHHGSPHAADTEVDASMEQDASQADAELDGGVDGSLPALTPEQCDQAFAAVDDRCQEDADCVVIVQPRCAFQGEGVSSAHGVRRDALAAAQQARAQCPTSFQGCQGEGISTAPIQIDDGAVLDWGVSPIGVCRAGRCTTIPSVCGGAMCGNAVLDHCLVTGSNGMFTFTPTDSGERDKQTEACDGLNLFDHSCESIGYAGGELSCVEGGCVLDASACQVCSAIDAQVTACASGLSDDIREYAVAATDTELAVVWTEIHGGEVLRFARYSADLVRLSEITVPVWLGDITIARDISGWIVAGSGASMVGGAWVAGVVLHRFDAEGDYVGELQHLVDASYARLTARSDGVTLLTYTNAQGDSAATVLQADATDHTPPVVLVDTPAYSANVIAAADAFFVAVPGNAAFTVHRVESDGSVVASPVALETSQQGWLVERDAKLAIVTNGPTGGLRLREIDPQTMTLTSLDVTIAESVNSPAIWGAPVGLGSTLAFAVLGRGVRPEVARAQIVQVDELGQVSSTITVASAPSLVTSVVRMGDALVSVFVTHPSSGFTPATSDRPAEGLGFARVTP